MLSCETRRGCKHINLSLRLLYSITTMQQNIRQKRIILIRDLEPGDEREVPFLDKKNWASWRSSAAYINRLFHVRVRVRKKGDRILIIRKY